MRRRLPWILAAAATAVIVAIGLSQAPSSSAPSADRPERLTTAQIAERLKGSPPALASLHQQADRVLDGGRKAFRARLAALKGHPVVVNFWAAWCGPCRVEFPVLQKASLEHGTRVAFVGIDLKDNRAAAEKLLGQIPLAFPSYEDPDGRLFQSYGLQGTPSTVYYSARGERTYVHQGPYTDKAQIDEDIRRYATT
ncbi:MAG: TlpA family protein disulfide reductase [Actinomycetota bacterium]|nr:TlpA family protein disulfide reductase [Actinomycetota bacterium]